MDSEKEDLDTFLTTIESKLRGPFSSLDLAKAVTTLAMRATLTPSEYIQNMSKVFSRTDKVIQLRMLIGLLGLEPHHSDQPHAMDGATHALVLQAQEAPANEEWVRIIAGFIQGIMFEETKGGKRCRGEEAQTLLDKTCEEVCQQVDEAIGQEQAKQSDGIEPSPDMNASFAPFRYSLLPPTLVKPLFPECSGENPHFRVNTKASVLTLDDQLDQQRAKEETEHSGPVLMKTNANSRNANGAGTASAKNDLPPGYRPTKLVASRGAAAAAPKTSLFMPKKPKAGVLAQQQQQRRQLQQKTALRRKGAAQSLVNNTSLKSRIASKSGTLLGKSAAAGASTGAPGSAGGPATARAALGGRFGGGGGRAATARSKMKMIDVQEVDTLNKEHAARDDAENSRMSKKRRILENARQRGLKKQKPDVPEPATAGEPSQPAEPASAPPPSAQPTTAPPTNNNPPPATGGAEEWRILLQERSNRLSQEDRERVQQFFEHRHNPTPDQNVVKMKLHEQRSQDPKTGQAIKETFYLELDYNSLTSKQSKKIKRY